MNYLPKCLTKRSSVILEILWFFFKSDPKTTYTIKELSHFNFCERTSRHFLKVSKNDFTFPECLNRTAFMREIYPFKLRLPGDVVSGLQYLLYLFVFLILGLTFSISISNFQNYYMLILGYLGSKKSGCLIFDNYRIAAFCREIHFTIIFVPLEGRFWNCPSKLFNFI